jgi:hypothetical protein
MMYSLSSLSTLPDEEFDMIGEDELVLLTRRFERLHEKRVNTRKNPRTCFQCGKPGHFVADSPEKMENKDGYKHRLNKTTSIDQGVIKSTKTSTRTSYGRGRTAAAGRPEKWSERAMSTPTPPTLPRARVAVKMKVISARTRSHSRT